MRFEWDEEKEKINLRKHGLSFEDARYVFADPFAISRDDYTEVEHRRQILGHIGGTLLVLVVYVMRDRQGEDVFRIISARKATTAERRKYEAGTWF